MSTVSEIQPPPGGPAHGSIGRYAWLHALGAAVGFFEAAVVVYLREIYYPTGFHFPLVLASPQIGAVEVAREVASILLLAAAARLAGRWFLERFAAFALLFGTWDLWYYVFLKLILGWPENLATADVLFLLPVPWVGPVWAPCVVAVSLVGAGSLIYLTPDRNWRFRPSDWSVLTLGGLIVIVSMTLGWRVVPEHRLPEPFPTELFWCGWGVGAVQFALLVRRTLRPPGPPTASA